MAIIIRDCEIWYPQLVKPNTRFNKENPTFEIQIRTTDKEQKKEWESLGIKTTPVDPDEGELYYKSSIKKRKFTRNGEESTPVKVMDASTNEIDPGIIGNGSIGNVRIFQYTFPRADGAPGTANILDAIQITTLKKFERMESEVPEFEDLGETTVIE